MSQEEQTNPNFETEQDSSFQEESEPTIHVPVTIIGLDVIDGQFDESRTLKDILEEVGYSKFDGITVQIGKLANVSVYRTLQNIKQELEDLGEPTEKLLINIVRSQVVGGFL